MNNKLLALGLLLGASLFGQVSGFPNGGANNSPCSGAPGNSASVGNALVATTSGSTPGCQWGTISASVTESSVANAEFVASVAGTNTLTGSTSPTYSSYAQGYIVKLIPANTNTSTVTIAINTAPAVAITKNGTTALSAGDLISGQAYVLMYDGTRFQIVSGSSAPTGNATTINGASVPASQTCLASNSSSQLVAGTCGGDYTTGQITNQGTYSILASAHQQGTTPVATCFTGSSAPYTAAACNYTVDASGNLSFTFSPNFTGVIFVSGGGASGLGSTTNQNIRTIGVSFDGGGSALTTSVTRCTHVGYAGTIQGVTLIADQTGAATIDVKTVAYASYTGPASTSSIAAAAIPALSSAVKYNDTTLTGWTKSIAANTEVCFALTSPATLTWVQATLKIAAN